MLGTHELCACHVHPLQVVMRCHALSEAILHIQYSRRTSASPATGQMAWAIAAGCMSPLENSKQRSVPIWPETRPHVRMHDPLHVEQLASSAYPEQCHDVSSTICSWALTTFVSSQHMLVCVNTTVYVVCVGIVSVCNETLYPLWNVKAGPHSDVQPSTVSIGSSCNHTCIVFSHD